MTAIYKNPKHQAIAARIDSVLSAENIDKQTIETFTDWFIKNFSIWKEFEIRAYKAFKTGKKVGSKCIAEVVRYFVEVESNGEFKVNNSYVAYLGRLFNDKYKTDFLETRIARGLQEKEAA